MNHPRTHRFPSLLGVLLFSSLALDAQVQPNSPSATLLVHGRAGDGYLGTLPMEIVRGASFDLELSGPPLRRILLLAGVSLEPGSGTPAGVLNLEAPVEILNGFASGAAGLLANTGGSGTLALTLGLQVPVGGSFSLQGAVETSSGGLFLSAPQAVRSARARLLYTTGPNLQELRLRGTNPFRGGDVAMSADHLDVEDVRFSPRGTDVAFTAMDTTMLVSVPVIGILEAVGVNVTSTVLVGGLFRRFYDLAWSRSGRWLAFRGDDFSGFDEIYLADRATGTIRLVGPSSLGNARHVIWSPRGDWLAFLVDDVSTSAGPAVYVVEPSGPTAVLASGEISFAGYQDSPPQWSEVSESLAYLTQDALEVYEASSGISRVVVPSAIRAHAWSPDGRRIAFLQQGTGGQFDLFTVSADGTDLRQTNAPGNVQTFLWSPDGRLLSYVMDTPLMSRVLCTNGAVGTATTHTVVGTEPALDQAWSASGEFLAYRARGVELRTVRWDGSGQRVANMNGDVSCCVTDMSWSPVVGDETLLYLANEFSTIPGDELHLVSVEQASHMVVSTGEHADLGQFDPTGRWIAFRSDFADLFVFDRLAGSFTQTSDPFQGTVRSLDWSPAATGSVDVPPQMELGTYLRAPSRVRF